MARNQTESVEDKKCIGINKLFHLIGAGNFMEGKTALYFR